MSTPLSSLGRLGDPIFDLCHYPYDNDPGRYDTALAARVYEEHMEEWLAAEASASTASSSPSTTSPLGPSRSNRPGAPFGAGVAL